jgi:hypothetical protein
MTSDPYGASPPDSPLLLTTPPPTSAGSAADTRARGDRPLRRFVPHVQESTIARGRNRASAFPGRAIQC